MYNTNKYSINNKFDNAFDLIAYTISAMVDSGYMPCDVDEFLSNAIGNGNYNLLVKSKEMIDECNKVLMSNNENSYYKDSWRDYYYGSDEEELFNYIEDDDEYLDCDSLNNFEFTPSEDYLNKFYEDDELEAYEGFDSCKNKTYNSYDGNNYYYNDESDDLDDFDSISSNYLSLIPYKCY